MWRLFPGAARTTWEHLADDRDDHKNLWKLVIFYENAYVEMSRNAYMKWDEIKKSNHPILDSSDVFCVQGD